MRLVSVAIASSTLWLSAPGQAAAAAGAGGQSMPGIAWVVFIALFGVLGIGMRGPSDSRPRE